MKKIGLILLVISFFGGSCVFINGKRKRGNGNIVTVERSVGTFNDVHVSGAIDVYVTQGERKPVKIEGDENLLEYIEVLNDGDHELKIRTKRGINLRPTKKMKVYISSPEFKKLRVSGACNIIGENKISSNDQISLSVSGAGDIRMEADAPKIDAGISGSGNVDLRGNTRDFELDLSGAGKARCYDLLSENADIEISGAGSAEVYASVRIDAHVSGAGNIRYKGNAAIGEQRISGAGSVKKVE